MITLTTKSAAPRILDFDIETRPLSFLGSDRTTDEITAIAWAWVKPDEPKPLYDVEVALLDQEWQNPAACDYPSQHSGLLMLEAFVEAYDQADIVTGHFIRGFDLPTVNGALLEYGLSPLHDKLAHDTKNDLRKRRAMSASQENLGAMLYDELVRGKPKLERKYKYLAKKERMDTPTWRRANRLYTTGLDETERRVKGDVLQHLQLRHLLLEIGWLDKPKVWRSSGALTGAYVP